MGEYILHVLGFLLASGLLGRGINQPWKLPYLQDLPQLQVALLMKRLGGILSEVSQQQQTN
jgi:hypothetical protein